jgi:hypothetical protein
MKLPESHEGEKLLGNRNKTGFSGTLTHGDVIIFVKISITVFHKKATRCPHPNCGPLAVDTLKMKHEETSVVCTVLLGKAGESRPTAKIAFIKLMGPCHLPQDIVHFYGNKHFSPWQ